MPDYVATEEQLQPNDPMKAGQPTTKSVKSDSLQTNTKSNVDQGKNNASVSRIKSSTIAGYQKIHATIPKNSIKPASSKLVNATAEINPGSKRERASSLSAELIELTGEINLHFFFYFIIRTSQLLIFRHFCTKWYEMTWMNETNNNITNINQTVSGLHSVTHKVGNKNGCKYNMLTAQLWPAIEIFLIFTT